MLHFRMMVGVLFYRSNLGLDFIMIFLKMAFFISLKKSCGPLLQNVLHSPEWRNSHQFPGANCPLPGCFLHLNVLFAITSTSGDRWRTFCRKLVLYQEHIPAMGPMAAFPHT